MRCEGCGGDRFVSARYNLGAIRAPALECANCRVLILDEAIARSEDERAAIRQAIVLRKAAGTAARAMSGDAETVPLMPAARPVPDESGNFKVGSAIPQDIEETGVRRAGERASRPRR